MKRAAIYARFSSDLQDERSIGDQIAVCRTYAERNGYDVVATFDDREISGAVTQARAGFQALLRAAAAGSFDAVIAESLSRIGRDQENRHAVLKRLTFAGVKLVTPSDGVVTPMVNGIRAIIDSQYLEDLKVTVRRGMSARVREGLSGGGRAYGYDVIGKGERRINEAEAAIVRRIYAETLAGKRARAIATALNAEHVPAPRGTHWRANTISGNGLRGNGILQNELYAGWLVWNRLRMVLNPDTEKRVSRRNPESEWQRVHVPALVIVDQTIFDAVQNARQSRAGASRRERQSPRRLLSGLLRCGACGAGMPSQGEDRAGIRIQCAAVNECGTCCNSRKYYLAPIERAVVSGLRSHLGSPRAIALYVETFEDERRKLAFHGAVDRGRLETRLAAIETDIARAVDLVLRNVIAEADAKSRLDELRRERGQITAQLAGLEITPPAALHRPALDAFLNDMQRLDDLVNRRISEGTTDVALSLRRIINRVTVMPAPIGQQPMLEIEGHLASLLSGGQVVAGGRFGHDPRQFIPSFTLKVAA